MWDDIIHDTLFIGHTVDDLKQEIRTNTWQISMREEERRNISRENLLSFFSKVIDNRREQIHQSSIKHGMWFYVWHDQQASQIRFSLISDFHSQLPFGIQTIFADLSTIVDEFLSSNDHIPFSALDIDDYDPEEQRPDENFLTSVLPVFTIQLL